jgi:bifunctional N-acetylglucosamine-1-phosphate-uridyltransferase/glucosamine-1-phosphate-acetyltransferase GlmU-like protein
MSIKIKIDCNPEFYHILAAGKGTRMKSDRAKVLHELFKKQVYRSGLDT